MFQHKGQLRKWIILITYTVVLGFALMNLSGLFDVLGIIISILLPVFYGVAFAYIIGLLVNYIKRMTYKYIVKKSNPKKDKIINLICITLGVVIFCMILITIIILVVPQLISNINDLLAKLPAYLTNLQNFLNDIFTKLNLNSDFWVNVNDKFVATIRQTLTFMSQRIPDLLAYTVGVLSGITNVFFGFVIAIYFLLSKEKLIKSMKKTVAVIFPSNVSKKVLEVSTKTNIVFKSYVGGQIVNALIMTVLIFVSMWFLNMPYAALIAVVMGLSNLIPLMGPVIALVPTTLVVFLANPPMALGYFILVMVLQQLDGNIIVPKVVGDAVGLSGVWVLIAIMIGGGLFGFLGMLIAVPIMAVGYRIFADYINRTYSKKTGL